jgi:hypothetical protein
VVLTFFGKQEDFESLLIELKQQTRYPFLHSEATDALSQQETVTSTRIVVSFFQTICNLSHIIS